jgi:hypothetical protein
MMRSLPSFSDLAARARSLPNGDLEPEAAARGAKATISNASTDSVGVIELKIDFLIIHLLKKIIQTAPALGENIKQSCGFR